MRALDQRTIEEIGIPSLVLMETAGIAVSNQVEALIEALELEAPRILLFAGNGNNGGDALVATRHLVNAGLEAVVVLVRDPQCGSSEFIQQLSILQNLNIEILSLFDGSSNTSIEEVLECCDVVVDGIFGTGLKRPIEGEIEQIIQTVNALELPVVSIDLPSGIDADTGQILGEAFEATATVALGAAKCGHVLFPGRQCSGEVEVADIGIPYDLFQDIEPAATVIDEDYLQWAIPDRLADSHKGTYGRLLVVAGTPASPGSALLAGRASLRSGTGLVTIGSCEETIRRLAPSFECLMGASLGVNGIEAPALRSSLERSTALAIGPSLVPDHTLSALLQEVLAEAHLPVVLDAGALMALAPEPDWLKSRKYPTILTPHPGEMRHLTRLDTYSIQSNRIEVARRAAQSWGCTIVLKGASTVVADPDGEVGVIVAGNPGLATAGTGDVLLGVIAGLLAQGLPASVAARAGGFIHARAGDRAAEKLGEAALLASDLLTELW